MFSNISSREMYSLRIFMSYSDGEELWENIGMFTKETPHRYILSTEVHRLQLASIYVKTLFPVWTLSSLMPILIYLEPCIFQSCLLWGIWLLLAASNSVSGLSPTRSPRLIPTPLPPCAIFLPFCWSVFLEFLNCIFVFLWFKSCLVPTLLSFTQHFSSFSDRQ